MTRIVLIDDDSLVMTAIASLLEREGATVASYHTRIEPAIAAIIRERPDVVVSDVMLQGQPTGLDLMERLEAHGVDRLPVVFLSSFAPAAMVRMAIEKGAAGYVTKDGDVATLVASIHVAVAGGRLVSPQRSTERQPTIRELEVIRAITDGYSTEEIGTRLSITGRTVTEHLSRMFERYGVASRTELVMMAARMGWITVLPDGRYP